MVEQAQSSQELLRAATDEGGEMRRTEETMPVNVPGLGTRRLQPTTGWQTMVANSPRAAALVVDEDFYVTAQNLGAPAGAAAKP